MGNKLGRRRQLVEDKYTRPQGLYDHRDVDHKKLRKLILEAKLSPCYPGHEDPAPDLDECPICFLYYPSLNRSRCCAKGICTECFLQMKPPHSSRPAQCPFCKTSNYAVEYRGVRTMEEKGMEQLEEQKVIEAKIRMRRQELLDEELRMLRKREMSSSNTETTLTDAGLRNITVTSLESAAQPDDVLPCEGTSTSPSSRLLNFGHGRRGDYNLDLEDLMVMEAIWLSIQETGSSGNSDLQNLPAVRPKESTPSGGVACAVAALAEHQNIDLSSSAREHNLGLTESSSSLASKNMPTENDTETVNCPGENWLGATQDSGSTSVRPASEWGVNQTNQVAEPADTFYTGSDVEQSMPTNNTIAEHAQATSAVSILPDSFDEQVMLAMALSLAEAQPRPKVHGMPRH